MQSPVQLYRSHSHEAGSDGLVWKDVENKEIGPCGLQGPLRIYYMVDLDPVPNPGATSLIKS